MKVILSGILGLVWLMGCQSDVDSTIGEKFGETFRLKDNEEARVSGPSSDSLVVVVENIIDSRCPTGVQCIWAGNARVALELAKATDTLMLTLCIGDCRLEDEQHAGLNEQDTASVTLGNQSYEVILKDVLPYPDHDHPTGEQEAVLEINPQ